VTDETSLFTDADVATPSILVCLGITGLVNETNVKVVS
jgi:hypothetical protein